jgi:hypothetical protein
MRVAPASRAGRLMGQAPGVLAILGNGRVLCSADLGRDMLVQRYQGCPVDLNSSDGTSHSRFMPRSRFHGFGIRRSTSLEVRNGPQHASVLGPGA